MTTFDDILNFVMPIIVIGFLCWIIYRIPIFKEMVNWVIDKFRTFRERRDNASESTRINAITYE